MKTDLSYCRRPVAGYAYRPFTTETVSISVADLANYSFVRIATWNKKQYVLFNGPNNQRIMQSVQAIRYVMLRPGEENINSKLSNDQGIEIFKKAHSGEKFAEIAAEYGVSVKTVSAIKNFRQRAGVTLNFLNDAPKKEIPKAVVASRSNGKRLSPAIANFIRRDGQSLKIPVKSLAKKYCVSERTIQRILKGDMYKAAE